MEARAGIEPAKVNNEKFDNICLKRKACEYAMNEYENLWESFFVWLMPLTFVAFIIFINVRHHKKNKGKKKHRIIMPGGLKQFFDKSNDGWD
jgi:hypothetical protein